MTPPNQTNGGSLFETEIRGLADVYVNALTAPTSLRDALSAIRSRPAVFAGSGGALAVAELGAQLHRATTGQPARADTPFGFTSAFRERNSAAVLVSAGGRNPDVRTAARAAKSAGYWPVVLLTCRLESALPEALTRHVDFIAHVDAPSDGFLATSSVIAVSTSLAVAYGYDLPARIAFQSSERPLRCRTIAVASPALRAVVVDVEARLAETGLSAIQIADIRNFAHGRHVGVNRHASETTVAFFTDGSATKLTERTAALLPPEVDVRLCTSSLQFPASTIELFGRSMALTASSGAIAGVDPARPGVPRFGRDLYRLTTGRELSANVLDPVERKLSARGEPRSGRTAVLDAGSSWIDAIRRVDLTALVLDYDGTCCATDRRYEPLGDDLTERLVELASEGMTIAFASGRGKSLHEEVRRWMPAKYWSTTALGLYNGTVLIQLDDALGDYSSMSPMLSSAAERLAASSGTGDLLLEARRTQIGVSDPAGLSGTALLPIVRTTLQQHPAIDVKLAASGHSVDIIELGGSKSSVIDRLEANGHRNVLAIGDQGQAEGNDFELLARTSWSLSVDQVSPDLSRCWNMSYGQNPGPDSLLAYLRALQKTTHGWRLKLRDLR